MNTFAFSIDAQMFDISYSAYRVYFENHVHCPHLKKNKHIFVVGRTGGSNIVISKKKHFAFVIDQKSEMDTLSAICDTFQYLSADQFSGL